MSNHGAALSMFAGFDRHEIETAMKYFKSLDFDDGGLVFREGDPGNALYIVAEGKIAVSKGEREIATMVKGRPFGEMAVLDGRPRTATCKAAGKCSVLRLDDAALRSMMKNDPAIAARVLYALGSTVTSRLRRADGKLLEILWSD